MLGLVNADLIQDLSGMSEADWSNLVWSCLNTGHKYGIQPQMIPTLSSTMLSLVRYCV